MQGIFQKENTDKVLKYGIYRHLPTYEKIIRNLVSFFYKEWDNGYLVVMAKYSHNNEYEEEYIDLNPILENLYIPSNEFLSKIKEVRIQNT